MSKKVSKFKEVSVPEAWGKNPIFAATRQTQPREVVIGDGVVWRMGVEPSFGADSCYLRGFDVRHAEVIFALLAYHRSMNIALGSEISLSYYSLLEIIGWQRGKNQFDALKEILKDLNNIWTEIKSPKGRQRFRVLSVSESNFDGTENFKLDFIEFHSTFLQYLGSIEKYLSIRLDIFNSMSSGIAKAIYLYLPSRALKCSKSKPFKITLTNLFNQIGTTVPGKKSNRLQKLTQNSNSVIKQLDNALINFNRKLRVSIEETCNGKDYNLCAWTEELSDLDITLPGQESLMTWFINGKHGTHVDFCEKINCNRELNDYEVCALEMAGINLKESERFLKQAKSLIGDGIFSELCGTIKQAVYESTVKNPIAYFIALVRGELLGELALFKE